MGQVTFEWHRLSSIRNHASPMIASHRCVLPPHLEFGWELLLIQTAIGAESCDRNLNIFRRIPQQAFMAGDPPACPQTLRSPPRN
jgi:hypothetical protein